MKHTLNENKFSFYVGELTGDDSGFLAITKAEPHLCVFSKTEEGAVKKALDAWHFFLETKGVSSAPTITRRSAIELSNKRSFVPRELVLAVA